MFNKKDEQRKEKKENQNKQRGIIRDLNKDIEEQDIYLDKEKRKLDDRNLLKKQREVTRQLNQENSKVDVDINIASSKIKDLLGLKEMTLSQIEDILREKRKIDKENLDYTMKIEGKGLTENEQKAKQFDAERE